MGAFQNASLHFGTPRQILFERATALKVVGSCVHDGVFVNRVVQGVGARIASPF